MKVTYIGADDLVFPTLGFTAKSGDTIEVPDNFVSPLVTPFVLSGKATPTPPSAAPDLTVGE
jgi:hypothetical protein